MTDAVEDWIGQIKKDVGEEEFTQLDVKIHPEISALAISHYKNTPKIKGIHILSV